MNIPLLEDYNQLYQFCTKNKLEAKDPHVSFDLKDKQPEDFLPQRDVMLLVDSISNLYLQDNIIKVQCDLSKKSAILEGHFPSYPIWPGVLQVQSIGQAGAILHGIQTGQDVSHAKLKTIYQARFMSAIRPPGFVDIRASSFDDGAFIIVIGQCVFQDEVCSAAILQLLKNDQANLN